MYNQSVQFSPDGCPNNCGYCREHGYPCIYTSDDSPLANKPYTCCKCGKKLASRDTYEYKGYTSCEECFDQVKSEVEELIGKAVENIEARHTVNLTNQLGLDNKYVKKKFGAALEVQGKESVYERKLREGELL